ncbi:MAG: S8 family serine peptidase [Gammaproteobacteria bacterium]|nr:S8 family serine peptidase [Gammaproteobacteria bacterium]MYD80998.1 S8 family serine peptidase [Gammaproteobacteria bacterium]
MWCELHEGEDHDLWIDQHGHGSHVTGTVSGNGYFEPRFAGMAPGVEHIRFAKVLSTFGSGSTLGITRGMDFLAQPSSCPNEGWSSDEIKPLIVNMSLSGTSLRWDGKSTGPRKLDSITWSHRQLYVVSNSNSNIHGFSNYAAAKNSLAVGAAQDSGELASFSSLGPTADGRLLPSIVGTGVHVYSAEGDGNFDTYVRLSGTSMSSPAVAGVAALIMDAAPEHREQPALVRARLMASAIKPDAWFESSDVFPGDNTNGPGSIQAQYGMGLVSARTSILNNDSADGWEGSGATVTMEDDTYAYQDVEVPEGASRLDVVMTWDEPPADTIASSVLNDLDLWIDYQADCGSGSCGEYSSESKIDNVEWVIVRNPEPGTYRVKIAAHRVYTEAPRAAVAWNIIRGDSTPQLSVTAEQEIYEVESGEYHDHAVELTVSTNAYVAAGTRLHIDCRNMNNEPCESIGYMTSTSRHLQGTFAGLSTREDGVGIKFEGQRSIALGEIAQGEEQRVLLRLASLSEEPIRIFLTATAWNAKAANTSIVFRESDADVDTEDVPQPPLNDSFESATLLDEPMGAIEIDTLLTSSESGESIQRSQVQRPARSVWFEWTAETSGLATFLAAPRGSLPDWYLIDSYPSIDVFQSTDNCCGIARAKRISSAKWSVQFFAEENREYRVRVSNAHKSIPMTLNWHTGERPPNDDFANAITLDGESGDVSGHNLGATIEPGETYGQLAASVWYRWTAPEDGRWEFQALDAQVIHVLVFSGNSVGDLRMVSGIAPPGQSVSVAASAGETYHIMIASPDAYSGGWKFDELKWEKTDDSSNGQDLFSDRSLLQSRESGSAQVSTSSSYGVEPHEPLSTGIQTGWRKWNAPSDGKFTWYWQRSDFLIGAYTGDSMEELQKVSSDMNTSGSREFVFDATQDEEYVFSVGRKPRDSVGYSYSRYNSGGTLFWGRTPDNDLVTDGTRISDVTGQIKGSGQFATTESDGLLHLGHSSLWYTYEVPQTGWIKFWIDEANLGYILSAFKSAGEDGELEFIIASRSIGLQGEGVEIIVYAEEGSELHLRIGNARPHSASSFTMNWEPTDPPNWLRYLGRVSDGRRDASGNIVSMGVPSALEMSMDGALLVVSTDVGAISFTRDRDTGELSFHQEIDDIDGYSYLLWDPYRERLYANNQDTWRTFTPESSDSTKLELEQVLYGVGPPNSVSYRGSPALFLGNSGDYLYKTMIEMQAVNEINSSGAVEYAETLLPRSLAIYPSKEGSIWYRWHFGDIALMQRELGSGVYRQVSDSLNLSNWDDSLFASSEGDEFLYSAHRNAWSQADFKVYSVDTEDFDVTEIASTRLDDLRLSQCHIVLPRASSYAADVLCSTGAYVVEFDPDSNEIFVRDYFVNAGYSKKIRDRFGRLVPRYSVTNSNPVVASPDGRHIYASTFNHGILIFERVGNEITDLESVLSSRIRRLDLIRAADNTIQFATETVEDGCISTSEWTVDGVSYTLVDSRWQQRDVGSPWTDINGTSEDGQLCSLAASESKEYRLVANITIEGETHEFASNFFGSVIYSRLDSLTVAPGEVTLDVLTITECTTVQNMTLNGVKYTVKESKWQKRINEEEDWSDIDSTKTTGELCPYDPEDFDQYRLVGEFVIDDETGFYSSNVMQEEEDS